MQANSSAPREPGRRRGANLLAFVIGLPLAAAALGGIHRFAPHDSLIARYLHHPVENVEVVRRIWDAYSRGDFDQIRAHADPAVVMITVEEGTLCGIEAVRKNHERWWEAWENSESTVEEVIDGVGDRVRVVVDIEDTHRPHRMASRALATSPRSPAPN